MTDPAQYRAEEAEARDPATTVARLGELLESHTDRVLQNPAFALVMVEAPDLWARLTQRAKQHTARSSLCPPEFIAWALRHDGFQPYVLEHLSRNASLTLPVRRAAFMQRTSLTASRDERPLLADFLTPVELSLLERGGLEISWHRDVPCPPLIEDEVNQLAALGGIGLALARRHPRCPSAILERLLADDVAEASWVLRHPNLSPTFLMQVLTGPHPHWPGLAAQNPALTTELFAVAAEEPGLWSALAENPSLPDSLVERFLRAPGLSVFVRTALQANTGLSTKAKEMVAQEGDRFRSRLAESLRPKPS